jgi:DNA-directed RNA polymerase subunit RPC12/RpoP
VAHIWLQNIDPEWIAHPLSCAELSLESFLIDALGPSPACRPSSDVRFLKTQIDNQESWVVLAGHGADVTVNGIPLLVGICVLRDRDEIRWSRDGFAFFSSEELAAVADLPQGDRKIMCPRCKQEIMPGTPAVRCPRCGVWHHQSEQLPCYTYAENCATCTRKTGLDGYEWTPEEL